jgi:hypothetical protein
MGRVVVEPGVTKTQFDANLLEPDLRLEEYREVRALLAKNVVLKAANAARPKLRYPVGRVASMRMLRRFAPVGVVDAAVRKNLRLDALAASLPGTPVSEK